MNSKFRLPVLWRDPRAPRLREAPSAAAPRFGARLSRFDALAAYRRAHLAGERPRRIDRLA